MKTYVIPILAIILSVSQTKTQVLNYEILLGKKNIGTLAVHSSNITSNDYSIKMDARMSLPLMKISSIFDVIYRDGILWKSEMTQKSNDKIREQSFIARKGNYYDMNIDGEKSILQEEVTFSVAMLYHFEPNGVKRVFSERFGAYATIAVIAPHHYELSLPDGKNNKYRYENGICVEMVSNHALSKVTFQLKNDKHISSGK